MTAYPRFFIADSTESASVIPKISRFGTNPISGPAEIINLITLPRSILSLANGSVRIT